MPSLIVAVVDDLAVDQCRVAAYLSIGVCVCVYANFCIVVYLCLCIVCAYSCTQSVLKEKLLTLFKIYSSLLIGKNERIKTI